MTLSRPHRIDIHCHHIPTFYRAALLERGIVTAGGIPVPAWSPELAVAFMDQFGIAAQVVSISEPGVDFMPTAPERLALARRVNDYTAYSLVHTRQALLRQRFGAFAVLPLGSLSQADVRNACGEAERSLASLGLDGIGMFSAYDGAYLDDPRLDPLLRVLDRREATVFVHPVTPSTYPDLGLPTFLYEFTFDTTRAAVAMAYRQVYTRYPRIRWVFAHAGGAVPFLAGRARMPLNHPGLVPTIDNSDFDVRNLDFSRHLYDTALSPAPAAMATLRNVAPLQNILFATDYPFAGPVFVVPGDPAPQLSSTFDADERLQVERDNALRQLPGLARRLSSGATTAPPTPGAER